MKKEKNVPKDTYFVLASIQFLLSLLYNILLYVYITNILRVALIGLLYPEDITETGRNVIDVVVKKKSWFLIFEW